MYYMEICIAQNPANKNKNKAANLWSLLYACLHTALGSVYSKSDITASVKSKIGVSFPDYKEKVNRNDGSVRVVLGNRLRAFANTKEELQELFVALATELAKHKRSSNFLIKDIDLVPKKVKGYSLYTKVTSKKDLLSRIEHQVARRGVSFNEAKSAILADLAKEDDKRRAYAFIRQKSTSNGQYYPLCIRKDKADKSAALDGSVGFNTFGLSRTMAVPDF
ncbi:type I-F CRISPR-associated endoribonuclease Cas6/Csy4 [Moraxella sp. ZJ142]|uniref:type I-F CRISPR-associated endoribonuclease Cas6/Csy4 n=1 Tax=Moraxella marmotae TaxID=3344520 RepID=UPI0035D3F89B